LVYEWWVRSQHLGDELVDVLLSVAPVSASLEGVSLGGESSAGASEFEGPEEVVGFLEVAADSVDLVDEVLHSGDALLAEGLVDDCVVGEGDALLVDLAVATLQNQFADSLTGGVSEGDVGLDSAEEVAGGLVDADEDAVVDLAESEDAEDADDLGVELVNTADADNEGDLGLGWNVDLAGEFGLRGEGSTCLRAVISAWLAAR
jgi:hypothetical protein